MRVNVIEHKFPGQVKRFGTGSVSQIMQSSQLNKNTGWVSHMQDRTVELIIEAQDFIGWDSYTNIPTPLKYGQISSNISFQNKLKEMITPHWKDHSSLSIIIEDVLNKNFNYVHLPNNTAGILDFPNINRFIFDNRTGKQLGRHQFVEYKHLQFKWRKLMKPSNFIVIIPENFSRELYNVRARQIHLNL